MVLGASGRAATPELRHPPLAAPPSLQLRAGSASERTRSVEIVRVRLGVFPEAICDAARDVFTSMRHAEILFLCFGLTLLFDVVENSLRIPGKLPSRNRHQHEYNRTNDRCPDNAAGNKSIHCYLGTSGFGEVGHYPQ
jgi:hypothetical protein